MALLFFWIFLYFCLLLGWFSICFFVVFWNYWFYFIFAYNTNIYLQFLFFKTNFKFFFKNFYFLNFLNFLIFLLLFSLKIALFFINSINFFVCYLKAPKGIKNYVYPYKKDIFFFKIKISVSFFFIYFFALPPTNLTLFLRFFHFILNAPPSFLKIFHILCQRIFKNTISLKIFKIFFLSTNLSF